MRFPRIYDDEQKKTPANFVAIEAADLQLTAYLASGNNCVRKLAFSEEMIVF